MMHWTEHKNGNQPWSAACTYLSLVHEVKKEDMRAAWAVRMVNSNFPVSVEIRTRVRVRV